MNKGTNIYIISAKRFTGSYVYAGVIAGNKLSHTTLPGWGGSINFAKTFTSIKTAKEWFNKNQYNLLDNIGINFNTLGIREIEFKTVKKL